MTKKVLFILKYRQKEPTGVENSSEKYGYLNSGVWQSAKFLCDDLNEKNIAEAKCVHAIDNNCVHADENILTEDGIMTIKKIVDEKYSGKVLSFNEKTKEQEWKSITNWMVKDIEGTGKSFVKLKTSSCVQLPICTSDHKFAVTDSALNPEIYWTEAKNTLGKYVVSNKTTCLYNKDQMSAIIGGLLGDSCISNRHVICFGHGLKQEKYADFKFDFLGGGRKSNINNTNYGCNINYNIKVTAQTRELSKLLRINGKKNITNIIDMIDPISLAFWYMDDGTKADCSYKNSRPNARLCTHSFSYDEHVLLVKMFNTKFNIDPKIRKHVNGDKTYYFLEFLKDDSEKFWSIISMYVHESMDYKLPEEFRTPQYLKYKYNNTPLNYGLHEVSDIKKYTRKKSDLYDITVEDNHNFFANGILIHNCIDKLVTDYKADIVIIEAFWVVPEKFEILTQLHPNIKWIIRNHSAMPFIASEGIIIDWSLRYVDYKNVYIACNDYRTYEQFKFLVNDKQKTDKKVLYLPNTYPTKNIKKRIYDQDNFFKEEGIINIGCFGSVRPLKNHLTQAQAAIHFAKSMNRYLKFHINSAHIEDGGNSALQNLISLFSHADNCELVCHDWLEHEDFLILCSKMDIGLQVSFTETFNIVAADLASQDIPVIGSSEISWLYDDYKANPNDSIDITRKMIKAISLRNSCFKFNEDTHKKLKHFCIESLKQWNKVITSLI